MEIRFAFHETERARLHVASAGDPAGPLILFLHGFPEYWAGWRDVMAELAGDFHTVAPDQRGYNLSSKPEGVESYRAKHLVADLASLADSLSPDDPFVLAGHDWGASVAYAYAFAHPHRLSRLIVANGVHPACFQRAIFEDEGQRRASQYMNRLRAPEADLLMVEDGYRRTFRMLAGFSQTDWMTAEAREGYIAAWSPPGAMPAMLNWYRASPIAVPAPGEPAPHSPLLDVPDEALTVRVPHLVIWGEADEALRPACLQGLERYAPDLTIQRISGAGHWLLHEKPKEVAGAIRSFLAAR
jgi:pimeloyl-ACP methyl ester carboxylesterase